MLHFLFVALLCTTVERISTFLPTSTSVLWQLSLQFPLFFFPNVRSPKVYSGGSYHKSFNIIVIMYAEKVLRQNGVFLSPEMTPQSH